MEIKDRPGVPKPKLSVATDELPAEFIAALRQPVSDPDLAALDRLLQTDEPPEVIVVGNMPDDLVSAIAAAEYGAEA